jgi:hypothetical protein
MARHPWRAVGRGLAPTGRGLSLAGECLDCAAPRRARMPKPPLAAGRGLRVGKNRPF